ncbi:phenylacetic acid degradation protein [Alkalilimnicola ehrlichii]|uniref:Phenylacetic acid degradation protein n=1 Tax=Alkalilimnicola ehrlichii TaxID=351052 RepID=A0A3E0X2R4_9GAMM|nr:PaaI family thioesterase [Alkalilimnicola ehrlichii]RFA29036.1 phenylacetic acid degradation protein [Alkalilimnicola ehrlichii]RFA38673.1 phenylacetic acid degradation protein [Alkalilimnicola ehrlichii]
MDKNAFFWQMQDGKIPPPKAADTLGLNILNVDVDSGVLEAEFFAKEAFTNPAGNIQGGFLAAMLDDTMGPALAAQLGAGEFAPTLNLNVQFLAPARPGKLQATGRVRQRGGEICFLSGELRQDGRMIAIATATAVIKRL